MTRCIGIVPSLAVALSVGRQGIDTLLVASQVALSIVLTFVLLPCVSRSPSPSRSARIELTSPLLAANSLIIFCAQHSIMSIPVDPLAPPPAAAPSSSTRPTEPIPARARIEHLVHTLNPFRRRRAPEGTVSYASPVWLVWLCCALWLLIGIANVYALYDVGQHGA